MNEVQSAPPQSDSHRFAKLPRTLIAYANDLDKHGSPLDSGLPEILRFVAGQIARQNDLEESGEQPRNNYKAHAQRLADECRSLLIEVEACHCGDMAALNQSLGRIVKTVQKDKIRNAREALAQYNEGK